jgi:hypothetical protein
MASVDLYWLPLGAGPKGQCVRFNGRVFEGVSSFLSRRNPRDLYHSALDVRVDGAAYVIEMTPVWQSKQHDRGVQLEGPVGLRVLGRSRLFRYEVRCWRSGIIPDVAEAVDSPRRMSTDPDMACQVLRLVSECPPVTWGRDELRTGDMWNSNSLVSWLLARSGHEVESIQLPANGRAPGWDAGLVVAARQAAGGRLA